MTESERLEVLEDHPDWVYLLREFYEIYRFLPAGGSAPIRSHLRTVRENVNKVLAAKPNMQFAPPAQKPVTRHLRRALDEGLDGRHAHLIRTIDAVKSSLNWQYGYEKVPRGLDKKYGYAEFAGPSGPIITDQIILGIVLFGPGCTYPAHAHDGITESYIVLSGAVSENNMGVFAPGSLIFNPPQQMHRITVSDNEPALLAYAWVGPQEKLCNQKMVFTRTKRVGGQA